MVDTYVPFRKRTDYWMPEIKKATADLKDFETYLKKLLRNKHTISTGKPTENVLLEYRNILNSIFDIKNILCKTHKSEIALDEIINRKYEFLKSNVRVFILNFFRGTEKHLNFLVSVLPEVEKKKQDRNYTQDTIDILRKGRLHSQIVDYIYSYIRILFILRNLFMNIKEGISQNNNKASTWKL